MIQRRERARFSVGRTPEKMGVMAVPWRVAGMSMTTSLLPLMWMISRSWRRGCQDAVLRLVLGGGASAAGVFDVDILDGGAEVGEAPGDVVVVTSDDEGNAGKGDAGDMEVAGGAWGIEVSLIPDAGDAVGEVHIVGEERLAGGGAGAGDGPVVGAGDAAFADGVVEGLLEGEEVLGIQRGGGVLLSHPSR